MNNRDLFEKVISYRSLCCRIYGPSDKYLSVDEKKYPMGKDYWKLFFDDIGYNFRMTEAQAYVGIEQLKKLDGFNERRIMNSNMLTQRLKGSKYVIPPYEDPNGKHVYHLYMIQLTKDCPVSKEDFMWKMYTEKGIKAWSHYLPIHLTDPYIAKGHKEGECPVTEELFDRFVTLPMNPRLTEDAINYMADCILDIVGE